MKIEKVSIEKFRSIKKASFKMNDITAIVGENNAGKTTILRALNSVFNFEYEEESYLKKVHQFAQRSNTYITICFKDVPKRDVYEGKICDDTLVLKFCYAYSEKKRRLSITIGKNEMIVDDAFLKELKKDISFVYIPTGRSNKDVLWTDDSIFQELVKDYAAKHTENKDRLSTPVRKATKSIHDSLLVKLEHDINKLYMQNQDVNFKIEFPLDLDYTALLENVEVSLISNDAKFLLREWGSGTKSMAIIAMHRAHALLNSGSIVLGIEEPEMNLHPQAQRRFIMSLQNKLHENETQAIFTTHSTVLIDELNHEDIVLVRRIKDDARGNITEVKQLSEDFWRKYSIEEFKHYQYFKYKNSDFFFSKYVVVGESKNDCQVFEQLVIPEIGEKLQM